MAIDDHTVLILGGCGGPNLVSMISLFLYLRELRLAQRCEQSPPTNVGSILHISASMQYMGWVCFWFSILLWEIFLSLGTLVFPSSLLILFLLLPVIGRLEKWGLQLQCLTLTTTTTTTTTTNFAVTTTREVRFGSNLIGEFLKTKG